MDFTAAFGEGDRPGDGEVARHSGPRALIRAAKLVSAQGEFVCVIRDVSAGGVTLRTFHDLPSCDRVGLELQNGECFELVKVRSVGREASFTFDHQVDIDQVIHESWKFPKRQLRLNIAIPLTVSNISGRVEAITENLSQQGARIECEAVYAIDQPIRIEGEGLPEIRAKVRWRKDSRYGVVFDNTFTLRDFAMAAARMQCPSLIAESEG